MGKEPNKLQYYVDKGDDAKEGEHYYLARSYYFQGLTVALSLGYSAENIGFLSDKLNSIKDGLENEKAKRDLSKKASMKGSYLNTVPMELLQAQFLCKYARTCKAHGAGDESYRLLNKAKKLIDKKKPPTPIAEAIYDYCRDEIATNPSRCPASGVPKEKVYDLLKESTKFGDTDIPVFTQTALFSTHFDTDDDQYYNDPDDYIIPSSWKLQDCWMRPTDYILDNCPTIAYDFLSSSACQLEVNDCPLIASIKGLAEFDLLNGTESLQSLIYPQDENGYPIYNPYGKYLVKIYLNGTFRYIIIDDKILVRQNFVPYTAFSFCLDELWTTILEKAILKLVEGYKASAGWTNRHYLRLLTGWTVETFLKRSNGSFSKSKDEMWDSIMSYYKGHKAVIACGISKKPNKLDMVEDHSYNLLYAAEIGRERVMLLGNCHGRKGVVESSDRIFRDEKLKPLKYNEDMKSLFASMNNCWVKYDDIYDILVSLTFGYSHLLYKQQTNVLFNIPPVPQNHPLDYKQFSVVPDKPQLFTVTVERHRDSNEESYPILVNNAPYNPKSYEKRVLPQPEKPSTIFYTEVYNYQMKLTQPTVVYLSLLKPHQKDLTFTVLLSGEHTFSVEELPDEPYINFNEHSFKWNDRKINYGSTVSFKTLEQIKITLTDNANLFIRNTTTDGLIGGYLFESNGEQVKDINDFPILSILEAHSELSSELIENVPKGTYTYVPVLFNGKSGNTYEVCLNSSIPFKTSVMSASSREKVEDIKPYNYKDLSLREYDEEIISQVMFENSMDIKQYRLYVEKDKTDVEFSFPVYAHDDQDVHSDHSQFDIMLVKSDGHYMTDVPCRNFVKQTTTSDEKVSYNLSKGFYNIFPITDNKSRLTFKVRCKSSHKISVTPIDNIYYQSVESTFLSFNTDKIDHSPHYTINVPEVTFVKMALSSGSFKGIKIYKGPPSAVDYYKPFFSTKFYRKDTVTYSNHIMLPGTYTIILHSNENVKSQPYMFQILSTSHINLHRLPENFEKYKLYKVEGKFNNTNSGFPFCVCKTVDKSGEMKLTLESPDNKSEGLLIQIYKNPKNLDPNSLMETTRPVSESHEGVFLSGVPASLRYEFSDDNLLIIPKLYKNSAKVPFVMEVETTSNISISTNDKDLKITQIGRSYEGDFGKIDRDIEDNNERYKSFLKFVESNPEDTSNYVEIINMVLPFSAHVTVGKYRIYQWVMKIKEDKTAVDFKFGKSSIISEFEIYQNISDYVTDFTNLKPRNNILKSKPDNQVVFSKGDYLLVALHPRDAPREQLCHLMASTNQKFKFEYLNKFTFCSIDDDWTDDNSAKFGSLSNAPQYLLNVITKSNITISLCNSNGDGVLYEVYQVDLHKRLTNDSGLNKLINTNKFRADFKNSMTLPKGYYIMVLYQYNETTRCGYNLNIHSDTQRAFNIERVRYSFEGHTIAKINGRWDSKTGVGCNNFGKYEKNPKLLFTVKKDLNLSMNLYSKVDDGLNLRIYKIEDKFPNNEDILLKTNPIVNTGKYSFESVFTGDVNISTGKYLIVPSTFNPNQSDYNIDIISDSDNYLLDASIDYEFKTVDTSNYDKIDSYIIKQCSEIINSNITVENKK